MKLMHLSDLHLGKRLHEASLLEDQADILEKLLDVAAAERPDAVLIAGDVYDKPVPPAEAVQLFDGFLSRLADGGFPVLCIAGNHDSAERLAFGSRLMDGRGVYFAPVYDGDVRPVTLEDAWGPVDFYLLPFLKPAMVRRCFPDEPAETYSEAVRTAVAHLPVDRGRRNVLVTHHPAYLEAPEAFGPAQALPAQAGSVVWAAVESGVALMALHTALDVNPRAARVLPDLLNLSFKGQVLVPLPGSRRKGYGQVCAVRGEDGPLTLGQLSARCTSVFGRAPRVWGDFSRVLARVVTCTGAAGGVAREALRAQADCLVCGEVKYHDALALSQAGLCIVDVGHDTSELPLVAVLAELVEEAGIAPGRITVIDQRENWQYPESIRV